MTGPYDHDDALHAAEVTQTPYSPLFRTPHEAASGIMPQRLLVPDEEATPRRISQKRVCLAVEAHVADRGVLPDLRVDVEVASVGRGRYGMSVRL